MYDGEAFSLLIPLALIIAGTKDEFRVPLPGKGQVPGVVELMITEIETSLG